MSISDQALQQACRQLGQTLLARGWMLATAESCTGGWLAKLVTDLAGSSAWFDCGWVTYSNAAKQARLGVPAALLARHGAVSEAVVRAMVSGALARSQAQLAVAISGIAGPGGGTAEKPVGTVWIAWGLPGPDPGIPAQGFRFEGDRDAVRRQALLAAMQGLQQRLPAQLGT